MRSAEFATGSEAIKARFAAEREYANQFAVEVVVLGADSWDDLKRTHSRYFSSPSGLAGALRETGAEATKK